MPVLLDLESLALEALRLQGLLQEGTRRCGSGGTVSHAYSPPSMARRLSPSVQPQYQSTRWKSPDSPSQDTDGACNLRTEETDPAQQTCSAFILPAEPDQLAADASRRRRAMNSPPFPLVLGGEGQPGDVGPRKGAS